MPVRPVHVASGTADVQVLSSSCDLYSLSARESGAVGTASSFILRDGTSAAGTPAVFVEVAADSSINVSYPNGLRFSTGIYVDRVSGETELSVHVT